MHGKSTYNNIRKLALLGYALFVCAFGFDFHTDRAEAATLSKPSNNLGLVGYWSFNEGTSTKALDYSGNGYAGTLTNGPTWDAGKLRGALNYDGSNDYVSMGDIADMGTGDFAISVWVKTSDVSGSVRGIINKSFYGGLAGRWGIVIESGTWEAVFGPNNTDVVIANFTSGLADGRWHHLVAVYDRDGSLTTYVDGVQTNSTSIAAHSAVNMDTSCPLIVGAYNSNPCSSPLSGSHWNGQIDEARLYSRTLSTSEITALYSAGAEKLTRGPSNSGLVGHWTFDEGTSTKAMDYSGNGNTGTLTNMDQTTDWVSGKRGKALDFDGSNDYVRIPSSSSLQGFSASTYCAWVQLSSAPGADGGAIINKPTTDSGSPSDPFQLYTFTITQGRNIIFLVSTGLAGSRVITTSAATVSVGEWTHVCATHDGTTVRLYKNATQDAVTGTYVNPVGSNSVDVRIGGFNSQGVTGYFPGKLDDVRVYNRALSIAEISALYNSGVQKVNASQNVTGSTLDSGLVGMWSFNGADVNSTTAFDRSGNNNHGTRTNGPTAAAGKVGQGMSLDGTDDYILTTNQSNVGPTSVFTLAAWAKPGSIPTGSGKRRPIIGIQTVTNGFEAAIGFPYISSGKLSLEVGKGDVTSQSAEAAAVAVANRWYHVAGVFRGGTADLYINGVYQSSLTYTSGVNTANTATGVWLVGNELLNGSTLSGQLGPFHGSVDEARVYSRALSAAEIKQLYNLGK